MTNGTEQDHGPTAALLRALARIGSLTPHGFRRDVAPGVTAYSTGTPLSTMNGVIIDTGRVGDLRTSLASAQWAMRDTTVPWSVQIHGQKRVGEGLRGPGWGVPDVWKTWVADIEAVPSGGGGHEVTISSVSDVRAQIAFADVLGGAFGFGPDLGLPLVDASVLADAGIVAYVGWSGDRPVATGMAIVDGPWVGVHAIATDADYRRRGVGAAMVSRIVRDGEAFGARTAYLQSSEMGLSLYRKMGFSDAHDDTTYLVADQRDRRDRETELVYEDGSE